MGHGKRERATRQRLRARRTGIRPGQGDPGRCVRAVTARSAAVRQRRDGVVCGERREVRQRQRPQRPVGGPCGVSRHTGDERYDSAPRAPREPGGIHSADYLYGQDYAVRAQTEAEVRGSRRVRRAAEHDQQTLLPASSGGRARDEQRTGPRESVGGGGRRHRCGAELSGPVRAAGAPAAPACASVAAAGAG